MAEAEVRGLRVVGGGATAKGDLIGEYLETLGGRSASTLDAYGRILRQLAAWVAETNLAVKCGPCRRFGEALRLLLDRLKSGHCHAPQEGARLVPQRARVPNPSPFTARSVNLDLSFGWPSITFYLTPLHLA